MNAPVSAMPLPPPASRSVLPTVLGWIAIVFGALGVYAGIVQATLFGGLAPPAMPGADPALQQVAVETFTTAGILQALFSAAFAYVGYGLWRRRNWARRTFIVLLAISVFANVVWALLALAFGHLFSQLGAVLGGPVLFIAVFSLAFAGLFFWCIRRLRSPEVKSEFVRSQVAPALP